MRHLIAIALLCVPCFAGTASISLTESLPQVVTLDAAPPGATALEVRVLTWTTSFDYGRENLSPSACAQDFQYTIGLIVKANGSTLLTERMVATRQTPLFAAYDGFLDYAGASGASYAEVKTKGATSWATYSGLPATIELSRRKQIDDFVAPCQPAATNFGYCPVTGTVEWRWI